MRDHNYFSPSIILYVFNPIEILFIANIASMFIDFISLYLENERNWL
jgi:hypothetical protein